MEEDRYLKAWLSLPGITTARAEELAETTQAGVDRDRAKMPKPRQRKPQPQYEDIDYGRGK